MSQRPGTTVPRVLGPTLTWGLPLMRYFLVATSPWLYLSSVLLSSHAILHLCRILSLLFPEFITCLGLHSPSAWLCTCALSPSPALSYAPSHFPAETHHSSAEYCSLVYVSLPLQAVEGMYYPQAFTPRG